MIDIALNSMICLCTNKWVVRTRCVGFFTRQVLSHSIGLSLSHGEIFRGRANVMLGSLTILAIAPFFIAKVSWNNKRCPNGNLCANAGLTSAGLDGELIFCRVDDLLRRAVTIGYEHPISVSDIVA